MRKSKKLLLAVVLLAIVVSAFCITASADSTDYITFADSNLKSALIKAGVDTDGDGKISKSEAFNTYGLDISNSGIKNLSGIENFVNVTYFTATDNNISDLTPLKKLTDIHTLILRDNNITDASPLSSLTNLEFIYIDYNHITSLKPFLSLKKLKYLSIYNNDLKTSVAAGTDSATLKDLETLTSTTKKNYGEYGAVGGAYNQRLKYDASKLSKNAPTYKVLVIAVSEIDASSKVAGNKTVKSKYKMSQEEINIIKAYAKEFEKYVERCSNYRLNLEVDFYVTTQKLTKIYAPAADYGLYEYSVFAPDIPEVQSKIADYDTTVAVCYLNREIHSSSGLAGYGCHDYNQNFHDRGVVFIPWDVYVQEEGNAYTVQHANELCYDTLIDTFVHEFTHTLEQYAPVLGYENIKEYHEALGENMPRDNNVAALTDYLSGKTYGKKLTGVPDIVLNNPPTKNKPASTQPYYSGSYVKPKKISNLKVSEQGSDYVKLTWTKSSNADGYKVYVYENGSSKAKMTKTVTSNSIKITSLSANTKYSFSVKPYKYYQAKKYYSYGTTSSKVTTYTGPKKVTNLKASKVYAKNVTLTWTKAKNADGYEVAKYNSSSKKWEKVKDTKSSTLKISSLASATTYKFRVRAYKTVDGKKYYSTAVTLSVSTKPTAPTISSVKRSGTKMTVNLEKVTRAKGYQVQLSTSKDFKKIAKTVTSKNKSVTVKDLKKGQKYYIRVRAYYEVDGKKVYSAYTTFKSAK